MNKKLWLIFLIGLLLFLAFLPSEIMYSDFKFMGWIIYGLIFGLLPFLVYRTIHSMKPFTPWRIIGACLAPLIVGPSFGFYHQYQEKKELEAKGIWTKCIVIDEKYSGGKIQSWLIKCTYRADNIMFKTNYENDESNQYSIGDTLDIIYSKDFPKIYRLGYEWKGNNNR
jgi:hypothetical protein